MAEKNKVDRPQKTTKKTPANRSTDAGTKRKDKKVKVSSALRINVPISQSLLLILPSLARAGSANADSSNKSNDDSHNTAEPLNERHDESLLQGTHSPKTEQAISTENRLESLEASSNSQNKIGEAPQETIAANPTGGSHSSRYLSVASHPQVHYVPSVSAPVITNGHTQPSGTPTAGPTNTAQPTTFASVTFIAETIKGKYGELHVDESGKYVFVLDPHSPQYIALQELQHGTDPFTLHLSNGSTLVIQIPVTGHQDAPSVSGDLLGFVAEDNNVDANGFLQANGKIDVIDPDQNESSVTAETLTGQYGTLTIDAQGHWQYQAKNSSQEIQALVNQTSLHETFIIHTKDGTPQTLEMTIGGTDDNAVVSGSDTTVLTEGTHIQAQGKLDIQDPDAGQDHFQAGNFLGQLGSLVLTSQGNWTYQLDNTNPAVQALVQGKTATDSITVHSADGTPHQITVTVNGTNNAAIIGGVDTASISENTAGVNMSPDYAQPGVATLGNQVLYADGKLTITDPDTGESIFEKQGSNGYDYHGTYGDLILQNDGTWHYHADAGHRAATGGVATTRGTAIDQLGEGQSLTDTITVHSKDGTTHDIVITIHGSNDKPYCSSEVILQSGSEDTRQTLTTAQLLANTVDVDANDAGKLTIENLHADHGSILNNADGTFTFTPEKDYNGDVHFRYDVKDAHGGVTHTGATTNLAAVNDNPDVTPLTDSVSEGADNHHTLNLLVGATDKEGDALTISHLEYAIDGQPQAGKIPAGITLDADGHTLNVDATDPVFNHLANGQSQQIDITYQVEDGHGGSTQQTATLTIAGTDDKATLVSNVIQLTETQALDSEFKSYRGQLQLIDPDSGDNTQFVFSGKYLGQGFAPGHLDVWPNGTYQFKLDAGTNRHADELIGSLHAGESKEFPYEVETSDGQKLTIMVKVTGEDNQAKIAVTPYSSLNNHVYEDHTSFGNTTHQLSSGGTLHVIDPDHDQAGFIAQTITTAEGGRFNINAQGHWSYNIDNDKVQHLGAGESFQQTFTVESIDGSAKKDITVTVHGTNDAPVASAEVRLANGLEDNKIVLTPAQLLANTSDVDDNDIGKLSIENLQADHGSILINGDGTFTFTPEKDYNGVVHFSYDVKDAHGGVTHTGASTTLSAVGDAATIAGIDTGSISENTAGVDKSPDYAQPGIATLGNAPLYADGKLTITDPDVGEAGFERQGSNGYDYHGTYGDLILLTDGTWHYQADAGHRALIGGTTTTRGTAIDQLGENQSLTDTITVHSKDGTTHDIVITIHGSNDRPYCSSEVILQSGSEDTRQTLTTAQLLANTVDVDKNDAGLLSIENLHADHGSILNNADGTFTFTPEKDYNGDVHFSYDVKDAHGGVTHTGASTTLSAVGDVAVITGQDTGSITEDHNVGHDSAQSIQIMGSLTVTDPDAGQDHFIATNPMVRNEKVISDPFQGELHIDRHGNWDYLVANGNPTLQALKDGETRDVIYEVRSADGTTHRINITVTGTNDAPIVSGDAKLASGTEDTSITLTTTQLLANASDVDHGETAQLSVHNLNADHGTVTDNKDGTYTFKPDADYNGPVHFTYDVQDPQGSTVATSASMNLAAVDDAAVITGTGGHLLEEDNLYYGYTIKTNGQFQVVDPDGPSQSKFPDGLHHHTGSLGGTLQLYGNGNYFYHIDNSAVNHLAKGQEAKETFTIHSVDGTSHQVEFVIEGTNDAPFVHGDVILSPGTEDTTVTLHVSDLLAQAGDYDDGETAQLSVHNLSADHGTVTDHKDGTYTFNPDADYNGTVHFTYDVQDPQGATVATSASMALAAVADKPILNVDITDTSDNTLNDSESGAAAISGTLDPSVASTLERIEITDGTTTVTVDKANITVATDGTYQTTADLTSLKDGTLTVTAHATSHDGTTATSTDTILKDTQVSLPTITFESAGADNLYSKAEIARGQANTITATVTPPSDAKIGEHLVVNGQDHVLDAHTLQHGIQIEVHPGSNVQATMTDEHGNTAGSQGFAASAIPEPIIVRPPSGSHQVSGTLGVPPLLPSLTPVPTAQSGWRIHLPNGQYVTSHHGQYGTLTIDPQTGHLHYQEQAQVHTGPHGSASGTGQHEDKFEVALQGTNQDEVVAHVNVQILSHGPGHSGKLTIGTEVVDMTITPVVHASHPAPPPPPPIQHDEPDIASQADFTVTLSDDSNLDLTQQTHQEPDQKKSHHGAAAYLDALGIKPDATSTTVHDQPADMDIVLAQVDQPDAVTHDQAHLDMSDALEHHDANINHHQDDEHHHHNDVDGLPDIDPNS